jgi:ABC-type multidrug transport system fused ATPase/permease subunit
MPNISKYIIEISVILGSVVIAALQFFLNDVNRAVTVLSIFLAASTRITPALLRIQQGLLTIKGSTGAASPTLELIAELAPVTLAEEKKSENDLSHKGFNSRIQLTDVCFRYPNANVASLENINFSIEPGQFVAIVGPSGAGKSTLVDLILGILTPSTGSVSIGGHSPLESITLWPGAIGYVPQVVNATNGSLESNITLGFNQNEYEDSQLNSVIRIAQLQEFVSKLEDGLRSPLGDRGTKISGGEKQRIGIARALFTKPKILVLDEATSSLDSETERLISASIQNLKGKSTLIVIAHRLSTVKEADTVIYIEEGRVVGIGTFEEIRNSVPNFNNQANLMGL